MRSNYSFDGCALQRFFHSISIRVTETQLAFDEEVNELQLIFQR